MAGSQPQHNATALAGGSKVWDGPWDLSDS